MSAVPPIDDAQLESLAKELGECGTGSEITRFCKACGLVDNSGESTKWRRLYATFRDSHGLGALPIRFSRSFSDSFAPRDSPGGMTNRATPTKPQTLSWRSPGWSTAMTVSFVNAPLHAI
jgi:hypothetical protein